MMPSSNQNEMNIAPSTNLLVKAKHIYLVTSISKVAIFHLCELLANVYIYIYIYILPAANELALNIIQ